MEERHIMRTLLCTCFALVAFAANSLLGRWALGDATIDAASFTAVRVVAGAMMLLLIVTATGAGSIRSPGGSWASAGMLFLYAVTFSFSYHSLTTGTGALILFGAVQVTMIAFALWSGERPHSLEWIGLVLALGGLVYLVFPGLAAPSPLGSTLMAIAGIGWGCYTLRGRRTSAPLDDTAGNFLRAAPMALGVVLITLQQLHLTTIGVVLAATSGALTSGLGYTVWYVALRGLTVTRAALVQLSVPVLASVAGLVLLEEEITFRLVLASVFILGGIALAVLGRVRLASMKSGNCRHCRSA